MAHPTIMDVKSRSLPEKKPLKQTKGEKIPAKRLSATEHHPKKIYNRSK